MKIVADVDLPFIDSMFEGRAEVVRLKGNAVTPGAVGDADALIVRSVTKVNERLLAGSRVSFVGTATIGVDHVDAAWLASRGIGFASAPGCNANAVSEYIVAALLELSARYAFVLKGALLGVVGAGNVGSRVASKAEALGMEVLLNDPPLERVTGSARYLPLDELMQCDIVTLHVPLTKSGPDATRHFFDAARIGRMKPGAILINSARGAVVDTPALGAALARGRLRAAAVDTWEGEPSVDPDLLSRADIATAHIAGYSADGKAAASTMIYDALCSHFGLEKTWRLGDRLPRPEPEVIDPGGAGGGPEDVLRDVVRRTYPIMRDDAALRKVSTLDPAARPGYFIGLRNDYPIRREFPATAVRTPSLAGSAAGAGFPARELSGIGFRLI